MKNLSKRKKITITSIVSILLIGMVALLALFKLNKNEEPQEEVPTTVRIQGDNASLNGVVIALDGEVIVDEDDSDTTIFKAEGQEVIVTLGSDVGIVNGEEKLLRDVAEVETEAIEESKQEGAYVYKEEVFVPIEFIEDVFDLEFNDETLEFTRDDEVIIGGEAIEAPEVDAVEKDESIDLETEEVETDDVDVKEDIIEEDAAEKPQEAPETTEKPANSNNITQTGTKPQTPQNSSNSASDSQSSNSSNSGSSNAGSNNSAPALEPKPQEPVTPPAPQPVKVTSITTDKVSLTLEVGQTGKMTANVQPSNADNKGVTFVSSNTSVATVDGNGNITAKGAGSALITAKSNENGNISVSIGVTVNEKPKPQPTYTGNSIVNRAVNELGWCKQPGYNTAFLGPYGCSTGLDAQDVTVNAHNGKNGWDVVINIYDSTANGVVSGVEAIIRWMMPTQGQQLINKLHDSSYYGGTHTFDGRSVTVSLESYGICIIVGPKY